jgi:hypothetical protein
LLRLSDIATQLALPEHWPGSPLGIPIPPSLLVRPVSKTRSKESLICKMTVQIFQAAAAITKAPEHAATTHRIVQNRSAPACQTHNIPGTAPANNARSAKFTCPPNSLIDWIRGEVYDYPNDKRQCTRRSGKAV